MTEEQFTAIAFLLAGLFSMLGGTFDWEFFMASPKAQRFVRLFGRAGARAFYVSLGLALSGVGAALLA